MKRIAYILCGIALLLPLFGHETSVPLKAGEMGMSINLVPSGGTDYRTTLLYENETDPLPYCIIFMPLTAQFNTSYGGFLESLEYGVTDRFSLGVRLSAINCLVGASLGSTWKLQASIYGRVNILDSPAVKIHASAEAWVSPLFAIPKSNWIGDGLINCFANLSVCLPVFASRNGTSLFFYSDIKYITSFFNGAYMALNLTPEGLIDDPSADVSSIESEYRNINRIAFSLGMDFNWKDLSTSLGLAFPVYDFIIDKNVQYHYNHLTNFGFLYSLSLCSIEFSWRYRVSPKKPQPVD